ILEANVVAIGIDLRDPEVLEPGSEPTVVAAQQLHAIEVVARRYIDGCLGLGDLPERLERAIRQEWQRAQQILALHITKIVVIDAVADGLDLERAETGRAFLRQVHASRWRRIARLDDRSIEHGARWTVLDRGREGL